MTRQRLPVATIHGGKLDLSQIEQGRETWTEAEPYGEMSDGTLVWESKEGEQYTRCRFYGKFFFIKI